MSTLNTVNAVEDKTAPTAGSKLDENDILSGIKQRRASVAPIAVPTAQLPRYLRDPCRYDNNRSRRMSMPVRYLSNGPVNLPSIHPATDQRILRESEKEIDKSSEVESKNVRQSPDIKECKSFPLDNRLQGQPLNRYGNGPTREINISSEKAAMPSQTNSGFNIPKIVGLHNEAQHEDELQVAIGFRSATPNFLKHDIRTVRPAAMHPDKLRRHSIAVSVISDSNRFRGDSPLPGMTDLGDFERSLFTSRDRVIPVNEVEADRKPAERKMSRYVPKPDNHMVLSLFSCICCCPLLGLVALIFSIQVDLKYENGKKEDSIVKSRNARYWALSAVAIGMMTILGASMYAVIVLSAID